MKIRTITGIALGFLTWWFAFYVSLAIFTFVWPEFRSAAQPVLENNDYSQFTALMLSVLTGMYFWVNPLAGWVTVKITKNRRHIWFTATPIFLFASFNHLYVLWGNLPGWYNVLVPVLIPPLVFLGGTLITKKQNV